MIKSNKDFPDSHNLRQLQKICEDLDNSFNEVKFINLKKLICFIIDVWYPQHKYERTSITIHDAEESYNLAVRINKFVMKKIDEISISQIVLNDQLVK